MFSDRRITWLLMLLTSVLKCGTKNLLDLSYRGVESFDHSRASFFFYKEIAPACLTQNAQTSKMSNVSLTWRGPADISKLYLSHNRISSLERISFDKFVSLVEIRMDYNQLEFIDIAAFNKQVLLTLIKLDHNRIKEVTGILPYNKLPILSLDLSWNNIMGELIPTDGFKFVNLSHNGFTEYRDVAVDTRSIFLKLPCVALDLSHNKIASLERPLLSAALRVNNNKLKGTVQLNRICTRAVTSLDFSHNQIDRIDGPVSTSCANLEELRLDHNKLDRLHSNLFTNSKSLKILTMSHNRLNELERSAFSDMLRLERLDLSHNRLTTIEGSIRNVQKLQHLELVKNKVADLSFEPSEDGMEPNLISLSVEETRKPISWWKNMNLSKLENFLWTHSAVTRSDIEFLSKLPALKSLFLENLELSQWSIALQQKWKLNTLSIKNSHVNLNLKESLANSFPLIQRLTLSNNLISNIGQPALNDLIWLIHLDLSDNRIQRFDGTMLLGTDSLRVLDLSNNQLTGSLNDYVHLPVIDLLILHQNPRLNNTLNFIKSAKTPKYMCFDNKCRHLMVLTCADDFPPIENISINNEITGYRRSCECSETELIDPALTQLQSEEDPYELLQLESQTGCLQNVKTNGLLQATFALTNMKWMPNLNTLEITNITFVTLEIFNFDYNDKLETIKISRFNRLHWTNFFKIPKYIQHVVLINGDLTSSRLDLTNFHNIRTL